MRDQPIRLALLALVAAAAGALPALAAATDASAPTPPRRTADAALVRSLQDHDWTLRAAVAAAGKPVEALLAPGHPFVMRFDDARVAVQGGCNLLSGSWRLSQQNRLVAGRSFSSRMSFSTSRRSFASELGASSR